jgi:hypothetical protein
LGEFAKRRFLLGGFMDNRIHNIKTFGKYLLYSFGLFFCFATTAYAAQDVKLQWDANQDTVTSYYVYYRADSSGGGILTNYDGTGAYEGDSPIEVPLARDENPNQDIVQFTVTDLPDGQSFYFVVTAYNNNVSNPESGPSNEVNTASAPLPDTTPPYMTNRSQYLHHVRAKRCRGWCRAVHHHNEY